MLPPDFHLPPARFGPMLPNGRNSRDPASAYDVYRRKHNAQTAFVNRTQPGVFTHDTKAGMTPKFLADLLTLQLPTK